MLRRDRYSGWQPDRYVCDGTHLYEIVERTDRSVLLKNTVTEYVIRLSFADLDRMQGWRIVEPAST